MLKTELLCHASVISSTFNCLETTVFSSNLHTKTQSNYTERIKQTLCYSKTKNSTECDHNNINN